MKTHSIVFALAINSVLAISSILDCKNLTLGINTTPEQEFANTQCWYDTVVAANKSAAGQRIAYIPTNATVQMMPFAISNLKNVIFRIDGTVLASTHWKHWPFPQSNGEDHITYQQFWEIIDTEYLTVQGKGLIDGQGYMWWIREILQMNIHQRPDLIHITRATYLEWSGVGLKNSPRYHMQPLVVNAYFHDFEIYVDIVGQFKISQLFWDTQNKSPLSFLDLPDTFFNGIPLPTFPLNTDGIDFYGRNATFRRIKITNFDDTVVPKPNNKKSWGSDCTQDILVEDCEVTYGVGMTIGTVVPNQYNNCIRNVHFRNIVFHRPIKAVYVKSNPGTGTGMIENILYENMTMTHPIWWAIYIGPQQQKQPGGDGPGCMFYPLNKDCETHPEVTMRNITLRNISSKGSILPAGIIRCNATNPCTSINFENVQMKSFLWDMVGSGFITENAYGKSIGSYPDPGLLKAGEPLPSQSDYDQKHFGTGHFLLKGVMHHILQSKFVQEMLHEVAKQLYQDVFNELMLEASGKSM